MEDENLCSVQRYSIVKGENPMAVIKKTADTKVPVTVKAEEPVKTAAPAVKAEQVLEKEESPAVAEPAKKAAAAAKTPAKKEAVKKSAARKSAAAKKETAKKSAAAKELPVKTRAYKKAVKQIINLQFAGKSYCMEDLLKIAEDVWKFDLHKNDEEYKSLELYVKPEESVAYYVFNGDITGNFFI